METEKKMIASRCLGGKKEFWVDQDDEAKRQIQIDRDDLAITHRDR